MTASVPGSEIDADNPDERNHPRLVSPAALFLVSEDAPNGRIVQAARGRFSSDMVYANRGMELGLDATWEDLADNADEILGTDTMAPKSTMWRDDIVR